MNTDQSEIEAQKELHRIHLKLRSKRRRNLILNGITILLAIAGIVWASNFFINYYRYEITNDATIEQYILPLNTRVTGYVSKIYFTDYQKVNAGDTLLIIDGNEYHPKVISTPDLPYTVITAPFSGYLGRRTLEEGQFIQVGQTIVNLVRDESKWVIANYKEKQIESIHIGQEIKIKVDAVSGKVFKGKVTSISSATGSKYSLLPTDNSSGNFVKIQQRIPVRIDFVDISDEDMAKLKAGMMVETEAIKHK